MNFHTNHRLLLAVAGISYFVLTLVIAIVPAFQMQDTEPLPQARSHSLAPTPSRNSCL